MSTDNVIAIIAAVISGGAALFAFSQAKAAKKQAIESRVQSEAACAQVAEARKQTEIAEESVKIAMAQTENAKNQTDLAKLEFKKSIALVQPELEFKIMSTLQNDTLIIIKPKDLINILFYKTETIEWQQCGRDYCSIPLFEKNFKLKAQYKDKFFKDQWQAFDVCFDGIDKYFITPESNSFPL